MPMKMEAAISATAASPPRAQPADQKRLCPPKTTVLGETSIKGLPLRKTAQESQLE